MRKEINVKLWNTILLIFTSINAAISIMDLPVIIDKSKQIARYQEQIQRLTNQDAIAGLRASLAVAINPAYRLFLLISLALTLTLLLGFFNNQRFLKTGSLLKRWPYYGQIIKVCLAIIVSVLTSATKINLSTLVLMVLFNLILLVPAILILKAQQTDRH